MSEPRRRVLVVDDSLTVRKRLCEIVAADPGLEVVGEAADGRRAFELCTELRPDVISLDMVLPEIGGLEATERIMAHVPTPILIVSASTNRAELHQTCEALAAGALDVLEKPRGDAFDREWERRYTSTLKLLARIKVITHPRARLGTLGRPRAPVAPPDAGRPIRAIALGASTGGPAAILEVLRALPERDVPLLFAMHIDEPFGTAFATWLGSQARRDVAYARGGEPLAALNGRVIMAPPGKHLLVAGGRLRLSDGPPRHSCRPSIDVLFESLARECGASVAACLLTGMGRDGAAGLLEIRRAGGVTIAQDESSSVVYGMPRVAAELRAAEWVVPVTQIGSLLGRLLDGSGRRNP